MKQFKYTINGNVYNVTVDKIEDTSAEVEVNGVKYSVEMDAPVKKAPVVVKRPVQGSVTPTSVATAPAVARPSSSGADGAIKSPLPGIILSIDCKVGDDVKVGQKLLVLEAMKMENNINSDRDGKVVEISVAQGASVLEGTDLVIIK